VSVVTQYFLPTDAIYGGVKVGYQFAELLSALGRPTVVASPEGRAAQWLRAAVAVVDRKEALERLGPGDVAIFSLPHDHAELAPTGAHLVFHCQGTDPLVDPILRDPDVVVLTGWEQAATYVREGFGREPVEVGIGVSDVFFAGRGPASAGVVAHMPRRGRRIAERCRRACPQLEFVAIDGEDEASVARILHDAAFFLATAPGEWFGLPALEAMAAGCVVLSVPVLGGMEYLRSGENCIVSDAAAFPDALRRLAGPGSAGLRARLRHAALATAWRYRLARQRDLLRERLPEIPA